MKNAPLLIMVVLVVLAAAWSANRGTTSDEPRSFLGRELASRGKTSSKTPQTTEDIAKELKKVEKSAKQIQDEIERNRLAAEQSVIAKDVSFSASSARNTKPESEYLTFTLSSKHQGKVLITGFEVKSVPTGRGTTIPKGVDLPFAGIINEEYPIFISPGDKVVLVTGRSPVGYSFRLNKCTGYFAQFQKFTPSLPKACPRAEDEDQPMAPNNFSDACLDFLETIPRCTMPLKNIPIAYLESQCQTFITEKLNYKTCVEEHKNDPDFYKKEWRIYLGKNEELWKSGREIIKLLDLSKKTVGTVTY